MNEGFWERINKLEELARKATQGEWLISTSDGIDWGDLYVTTEDRDKADMQWIATVDYALFRADETPTDFKKEQNANACYIAAANPAMILEMIAELRSLEKRLNDKKAHIGTQAARIKILEDNLSGLQEAYRKLDKEADWLACQLETREHACKFCYDDNCDGANGGMKCGYQGPDNWREAARKAVSESDNA